MSITIPAAPRASRLTLCLPFSLNVEAGYQDLHGDAGNWTGGAIGRGTCAGTMRGVTPATYARFHEIPASSVTVAMMQAITAADATAIYGALYWNPIQGDALPPGVNLSTLDHQILAGADGAKCLQRALGMTGSDVDGWIGDETLKAMVVADANRLALTLSSTAAKAVQAALGLVADGKVGKLTLARLTSLGGAGGEPLAAVLCGLLYDRQMTSYRGDAGWAEFGNGWTNRAVARLAAGLKMAAAPPTA